jgi:hypothetical protein
MCRSSSSKMPDPHFALHRQYTALTLLPVVVFIFMRWEVEILIIGSGWLLPSMTTMRSAARLCFPYKF